MRFAWPCMLAGAAIAAVAACVGEDPDASQQPTNDASTDGPTTPGEDGAPGTDAGGDTSSGPGDGVEGNVIDLGAAPVENAAVRINNVTVTTDAAGQFKIPKVDVPYDVDVLSPLDPTADGTTKFVMSVRGVTTRTPIVHVRFTGAERRSNISGTTSNLTFSGNNNRLKVAFIPQVGLPVATTTPGSHAVNPESFSEVLTFQGKQSVAGVWYFLHWSEPTATPNRPSSWGHFEKIQGTVNDNVNTTLPSVTLKTVLEQATLSGTITYPAGVTGRSVSYGISLAETDRGGFTFGATPYAGVNTFSMAMPNAVGLASAIRVVAIGSANAPNAGAVANQVKYTTWKRGLMPNATNVTLAFATAPGLTTPAEGSTTQKVTDTIKWTGGSPPYRVDIDCKGYKASVITMATEAVLPAGLGSWPATPTACTATVSSYGSVTTIDAYVAVDAPYKTTSMFAADGTLVSITNAFTSSL